MSLTPGDRLGAYEIIGLLGAGGMGEVYRAKDTRLKREVAIKILPDAFAQDAERLARFQREAELLASLNHANIAGIFGLEQIPSAGSVPEAMAIVLELVEGETLADLIARARGAAPPRGIPLEDALPIARQVADAVSTAHHRGVIHRDLKPANVKVTADGNVKVLDFGLAKALEPDHASATVGLSLSPTITSPVMMTGGGVILGTAAYMSPEQAKGKIVDQRTDVWAFGCLLFEMLSGIRPFEGEDVSETLASILRAEPDWNALPSDLPEEIRLLIKRCLEKDRARRLADFSVVQFLLSERLPSAPSPPQTKPAPLPFWRRTGPTVGVALAAALIAAAAAFYARPSPARRVTRFSFSLGEDQRITNGGRNLVAISPDGTQMVYAADFGLWLRSMSDLSAKPISGTANPPQGVTAPVFSPDGKSIAYGGREIKIIPVSGGAAVTIPLPPSGGNPYGISWSPDGILVSLDPGGIMRIRPDGMGKPETLVATQNDELFYGPQMLPGGDVLLFTVATGTETDRWDHARIVAYSLKTGERKTVIENGSDARYLPTGHIVYALSGGLYAVAFDLKRLQVTSGSLPVVEGIKRPAGGQTGAANYSVANDGTLMFIRGPKVAWTTESALIITDGKGGREVAKLPPGSYLNPRVSPDGRYVAFARDDGKGTSVWIASLSATASPHQLTFDGKNQYPIWSPDSQRVAFTSDREGDQSVFLQKADGSSPAERLTRAEPGVQHVPTSWSPDDLVLVEAVKGASDGRGRGVVFEGVKGASHTVWTVSLKDKRVARIAGVQSTFPIEAVFSHDGRWIAYQSNDLKDDQTYGQVFVQPFPATGAKYSMPSQRGYKATWARDDGKLFYLPASGDMVAMTIATKPVFAFGNAVTLSREWGERNLAARGAYRGYDILPDGRFIAAVPGDQAVAGAVPLEIDVVMNWFEELKQRVPVK